MKILMRNKKYSLIILISLFIILLDQLTKFLVLKNFALGESVPIMENVIHLTFVTNTGSAFGLFKGINFVFITITLAVIGIVIYQIKKLKEKEWKTQIALATLLGGAVGNLIDRILHGHVIDFIDFRIWPVFNIADSAITVSVVFLIILLNQ